ncbi:MAG TPA: hypothetical protein VF532_13670 [Candidatus Angelobacter sp.]
MAVRYFDGITGVRLGDRVALRVLFRRRVGRVVYVPKVSHFNPEFEYNGMTWVGIRLEDRSLVATPILAKTGNLKKKIKFIERDSSPCELIEESSREFEKHGEGVSP